LDISTVCERVWKQALSYWFLLREW